MPRDPWRDLEDENPAQYRHLRFLQRELQHPATVEYLRGAAFLAGLDPSGIDAAAKTAGVNVTTDSEGRKVARLPAALRRPR